MGRVFKKNDDYWIDYVDCNGNRVRRKISKSKTQATQVLNKVVHDVINEKYDLPKSNDLGFLDLLKEYMEKVSKTKKSCKTDVTNCKPLVNYFHEFKIHNIKKKDIMDYIALRKQTVSKRKRPLSNATVNRERALLHSIFRWAIDYGYMRNNPVEGVKKFKETNRERILEIELLEKMIEVAPHPLKEFMILALNTGMRRGEILYLEWERVNLEDKTIRLYKTKTGKQRDIPMNDAVESMLRQLKLRSSGQPFVFTNPQTKKPYQEIKTSWNVLLKKFGISDFRFHDLRHCAATYCLIKGGGNLRDLADLLGHESIQTTMRYSKALMEGKKNLVNALNITARNGTHDQKG